MSDEWVTIPNDRFAASANVATFYANGQCRLPLPATVNGIAPGDWQFNRADVSRVRFSFHEGGGVSARPSKACGKRSLIAGSAAMQRHIGRRLRGPYPCTIDGNAIVIDISEQGS